MFHRGACLITAALLVAFATGCEDLGDTVEPQPHADLSVTALDFGSVAVNQSATRTLGITNDGTGTLEGTATLSGTGYAFVSGGGAFALDPGAVWTIVVRFTPNAAASFPGVLHLGPDAPEVPLTGIGATQGAGALCLVLPASVDFGFVARGQARTQSFQIFSVGTAPLAVNVVSNATGVQVVAGSGQNLLDPGISKTVDLSFSPQLGGRLTGTIAVGAGCPEVTVQGVGTTVSLANDLRPVMDDFCGGCHIFNHPTLGYGEMVNRTSYYYPPRVVVVPFDPANSTLYTMITAAGPGPPMPQNRSLLSQRHRDLFRAWILEGATNN